MSSTNKTSLGLNKWEASDKPVRQDFVNDNVIIDEKIAKLNSDLPKCIQVYVRVPANQIYMDINIAGIKNTDFCVVQRSYLNSGSPEGVYVVGTGVPEIGTLRIWFGSAHGANADMRLSITYLIK
jgi:hypothetical protein